MGVLPYVCVVLWSWSHSIQCNFYNLLCREVVVGKLQNGLEVFCMCLLFLHCQHGQPPRWSWLNPLLSVWLSVSDCVYSLGLFSLFGVSLQICETTKVYPYPYPLRNFFFCCGDLVTYQWAILPGLPLMRYCSLNAYTAACWLASWLMWEAVCSRSFYTDEDF